MSMTWEESDKLGLSWDEVDKLNLTWDDLDKLTFDELMELAKEKLERFPTDKPLPPEHTKELKALLGSLLIGLASDATYDALKSVDWNGILKSIIHLLS